MLDIPGGFCGKLEDYIKLHDSFELTIEIKGSGVYDSCCFGVDKEEKLSDDRYKIFYNQPKSPNEEIALTQNNLITKYDLNISKLPQTIDKLIFTISVEGDSVMKDIETCSISISQYGIKVLEFSLSVNEFQNKKVITFELYRKDVWHIGAIGRDFNGGLSKLLELCGGEEAALPEPAKKISLEKMIEQKAPALISLVKPLKISLEKHKLQKLIARVGLVIDMSGSMRPRFNDGSVQTIVNKALPLALQFDDDGELDAWFFGESPLKLPNVTIDNYKQTIPADWKQIMKDLVARNNEPAVMEEVISLYKDSKIPAYIIFISDGGVSQKGKITKLIKEASTLPIFWQFVGISSSPAQKSNSPKQKSNCSLVLKILRFLGLAKKPNLPKQKQRIGTFGVLEALDTMEGRFVDNAGFFSIDDFDSVSDEELYERLLGEFPTWLEEIKRKGMI